MYIVEREASKDDSQTIPALTEAQTHSVSTLFNFGIRLTKCFAGAMYGGQLGTWYKKRMSINRAFVNSANCFIAALASTVSLSHSNCVSVQA